MGLLSGVAAFRFRKLAQAYLEDRESFEAFLTKVEPVLLSASSINSGTADAVRSFLNRLEEIRFTEPHETRMHAVEEAIVALESIDDPKRLSTLTVSARKLLRRLHEQQPSQG